jgi:hypothetical protein
MNQDEIWLVNLDPTLGLDCQEAFRIVAWT